MVRYDNERVHNFFQNTNKTVDKQVNDRVKLYKRITGTAFGIDSRHDDVMYGIDGCMNGGIT